MLRARGVGFGAVRQKRRLIHGDHIIPFTIAVRSRRDGLDHHRGCVAGGARGGSSLFQVSEMAVLRNNCWPPVKRRPTPSRRHSLKSIFVMQSTEDRPGDDSVPIGDAMATHSRQLITRYVGNAWAQARVRPESGGSVKGAYRRPSQPRPSQNSGPVSGRTDYLRTAPELCDLGSSW